ncbi:VCBS repeat-containing protein [Flagellimonas crocea]|uniref:VCBS repeat-containing protein n=1 Tax=Flagellimonas crocea TaxID=3067311 RepID=UPI00296F48FE|nr:VCBS repeat-containing protein [Muricauda sp. DH64]
MIKHSVLLLFAFFLAVSCSKKEENKLFSKVSSSRSGVTFNNQIIETDSFNILTSEYIFNGGGVAVGDFNNDNKPDLFFTGNQVPNKLYLNQGDFKFKDVTKAAGVEAADKWKTGVAVIDINNDSLLDIYICAAMYESPEEKANMLYINQGVDDNGVPVFKEMAKEFGVADTGNSMNAAFIDYNKDGLMDLYVLNNVDIHILPANYREKITDGSSLSNDHLYRNNGDNTFTDVTMDAGITIEGYGLGVAISDLNYDGWPDIYVSNDYLSNDIMYINNGDGTFTDKISDFIKHQSKFSMGSDIADFNNDGYLDIVTLDMLGETNLRLKTTIKSTMYNDYYMNDKYGYDYQYMRNMLQMGQGPETPYSEIGLMAGIAKTDWSWSPLFVDADNDGRKDLLITNGFPRDITDLDFGEFNFNVQKYLSTAQILDSIPVVKIPNYAYRNEGNGQFKDVGEEWGLSIPSFSNGAAFVDLDDDGDLDYVVNNINDEAFIFQNNLQKENYEGSNFLKLDLKGPKSNRAGLGTKVALRFEDGTFQFYEHQLSRGYLSTVHSMAHFGLGPQKQIVSLEIVWPDGKYQKIPDVQSNQTLTVDYGNASMMDTKELAFPLAPKKPEPIYVEVSDQIGVDFIHEETDKIDFNVQTTLPHKLTQNGPRLAKGDINGDGYEDFIIGSSSGYSPMIFMQDANGNFKGKAIFEDEASKKREETGIALFDLDNDGDLDIYMVAGSNEFDLDSPYYQDYLMINQGNGTFVRSMDRLPKINSSGSVVEVEDFDGDGYVDLFVGGRTPFSQYPKPDNSYLLKNEKGTLVDVTDTYSKALRTPGMITDAKWADLNQDNLKDLILVGEFMPVTVFINKKDSFEPMGQTGMQELSGWWECVLAEDFDGDGDIDLIAGNLGENNLYNPSKDRPVTMLAKDFDNNGAIDPVMFAYFKSDFEDATYRPYPVNFWGDLMSQSPMFRKKFNYFREFAKTTKNDLFTPEQLEGADELMANHDETTYFENDGNGSFTMGKLPWQTQLAPIKCMIQTNASTNSSTDVLMIGNDFGNEVFIGRYDAFNGGVLMGDNNGGFEFKNAEESGFKVTGDAKDMVQVERANGGHPYIVVTQNRGKALVFTKAE